mgnify:CR=1 FL=1
MNILICQATKKSFQNYKLKNRSFNFFRHLKCNLICSLNISGYVAYFLKPRHIFLDCILEKYSQKRRQNVFFISSRPTQKIWGVDWLGGRYKNTSKDMCIYISSVQRYHIKSLKNLDKHCSPPPPSKSLDPLHFVFHCIVKILGSGRICPCRQI